MYLCREQNREATPVNSLSQDCIGSNRVSLFHVALANVIATAVLMWGGLSVTYAQQLDFSGKWSLSGQIIAGRSFMSFARICDLKQTGDQLAGQCRGPNGGCSTVGVVAGGRST
jgi:hypothetical protein